VHENVFRFAAAQREVITFDGKLDWVAQRRYAYDFNFSAWHKPHVQHALSNGAFAGQPLNQSALSALYLR
jgi:hypothetical protein